MRCPKTRRVRWIASENVSGTVTLAPTNSSTSVRAHAPAKADSVAPSATAARIVPSGASTGCAVASSYSSAEWPCLGSQWVRTSEMKGGIDGGAGGKGSMKSAKRAGAGADFEKADEGGRVGVEDEAARVEADGVALGLGGGAHRERERARHLEEPARVLVRQPFDRV